ncbi:hypothetical protein CPB83DRAFT_901935, partial [Crepidotus variabilis]
MTALIGFPFELLGLIFEELYRLDKEPTPYYYSDPRDPNRFPWVLSRVCQRWLQVAARYSYFWTSVSLDISSKEPLPMGAFEWSKDQPFEALIYHSRYRKRWYTLNYAEQFALKYTSLECKRIQAINEALTPRLSRCVSLEYDVLLASSLPNLLQLTPVSMPQMRTLKLAWSSSRWQCSSPPPDLTISIGVFQKPYLSSYSIYHYEFLATDHDAPSNSRPVSIAEFLGLLAFSDISSLELEDLSVRSHSTTPSTSLFAMNSTVINCSRAFLDAIFQCCFINAESTEIDNSILPNNTYKLNTEELRFTNMPLGADLFSILTHFASHTLRFDSCPCLTDELLHFIANISCDIFENLGIENCTRHSIQAIKDLVMRREEIAAESEQDPDRGISKMVSVDLRGIGPKPSLEEVAWFTEHLETFEEFLYR